jgi:hypothetical protein
MRTNLAIAALIFPMIQAMLFGLGILGLLVASAPTIMYPVMIAATFLASLPIAFVLAPRLRSKVWRARHGAGLGRA